MNNNQGRRRTRRVRQQRKQKNTQISRILLTICMIALVAVVSIGGTVAWLAAQTQTVVNTFATNNVELALTESTGTEYQFIPGKNITKDPTVTITNTIDAYVFLKVEESNWPNWTEENSTDKKVQYQLVEGWDELEGVDNVFYRVVTGSADENKVIGVLVDNQITVSENIVNAEMKELTEEPTLTFTAYAIQTEGFDGAAAAWVEVSTSKYAPTNP